MGHVCVPSSEHAKIIWQAHYSQATRNFGVEKTMIVLYKYFYWPNLRQDFNKYIRSCIASAIPKPTIIKQGLYNLLPTPSWLGNPSPWITFQAFLLLRMATTLFLWSLTDSQRWPLWRPARRVSQQNPLLNSSLNEFGYTLGSHSLSSQIRTRSSLVHFDLVFGWCWTPSSLSP